MTNRSRSAGSWSVLSLLGMLVWAAGPTVGDGSRSYFSVLEHFAGSDAAYYSSDWVSRFHLDVDGDGRDEVFISHDSTRGNAGEGWMVYSVGPEGLYRPRGDIGFHRLAFRLVSDPNGIDTYWRYGGGTGAFTRYALTETGFEPVEGSGEIAADSEGAQLRFQAMTDWRREAGLVFYRASIAGLRRGEEVWRQEVRQGLLKEPDEPLAELGRMELQPPEGEVEE